MKYYNLNNEIYAFEVDGSQDSFITEDMIPITWEDAQLILNPPDTRTEAEKEADLTASLPHLTRRQFRLALHRYNLLNTVENSINAIEDEYLKTTMQIEFQDAVEFFRTSASILYMIQMLGLTEKQVNDMWQEGLTL